MHRFLNCLLYYLHFFCITWIVFCIIYTSSFVLPELSSVLFTLLLYYLNCLLYYIHLFVLPELSSVLLKLLLYYLNCLLYYFYFLCFTWRAFPGALVPDRSPHSGHSRKMRRTPCILGIFYCIFQETHMALLKGQSQELFDLSQMLWCFEEHGHSLLQLLLQFFLLILAQLPGLPTHKIIPLKRFAN